MLTLVVRPFRAEAVLKIIAELDVNACVVQEAKGYSRQKNYLERYLGSEYSMAFLPKVEITVWVSDQRAQEVADQLTRAARTGRIGDGKVFMADVSWPGGSRIVLSSRPERLDLEHPRQQLDLQLAHVVPRQAEELSIDVNEQRLLRP